MSIINTSDTYWDVNGVSLQTYAYNIETWGGDREAPPPFRGTDLQIPSMIGQQWLPRIPDSRIISLSMWVMGANPDGSQPTDHTQREVFENNWKMLRKLLWTPNKQITLTKRFRLFGSSEVITASAKAQFSDGLNPEMNGTGRAVFTVDLLLSDPFFYGEPVSAIFRPTSRTQSLDVQGDYLTTDIHIQVPDDSEVANITFTNLTETNKFIAYTGTIPLGDSLDIDVKNYSALYTPAAGSPVYRSGLVSHTVGETDWFYLDNTDQNLHLTVSGSGNVYLTYRPAWI